MMKKIWGVSLWIWGIGLCLVGGVIIIVLPGIMAATKPAPMELVKKELWKVAGHYEVRGQIYNPRKDPARNITVSFKLSASELAREDKIIRVPKGDANATLDYIPAGKTVDFTAVSDVSTDHYGVMGIDAGELAETSVQ